MRLWIAVLILLFATTSAPAEDLFIGFWNVENLFDTEDDPAVEGDEEYTPDGEKKWDDKRFRRKLKNLSRVIVALNGGKGPDVLGICEVENRKAAEELAAAMTLPGREYKVVHQDSPSGRGIDCAIIFDAKVFTLAGAKFHPVKGFHTRDITEATLKREQDSLTVFMNHWPARSHDDSHREAAAGVLRKRLDEILAADPQADIVIGGDLNDTPENASVLKALKTTGKREEAVKGVFYNTMWELFKAGEKGTYVWEEKWETIDQVIVSPGLLDNRGFHWKEGSADRQIVVDDQLYDPKGDARIPRPNRTYSGPLYHATGYSDHLPVGAILQRGK